MKALSKDDSLSERRSPKVKPTGCSSRLSQGKIHRAELLNGKFRRKMWAVSRKWNILGHSTKLLQTAYILGPQEKCMRGGGN